MDDIQLTPRQRIILAAFAAGPGAKLAPVQVQKLFFLIDENTGDLIGGRQFSFEPYDYGPFDKDVYRELETLERDGLVQIDNRMSGGSRRYSLTIAGQEVGARELEGLSAKVREYFTRTSMWVRSLSFEDLVGAIYKAFPDMKANSIFKA